jgi:3-mercaptopyruvate sulfurtransferase SseA
MRGGHIPGSVNVPFGKLVSPDDYSVSFTIDQAAKRVGRFCR